MYKRILVSVDGSEASARGLREAIRLTKDQGATLRLVHVVDELVISGGLGGAVAYDGGLVGQLRASGKQVLESADALVQTQGLAAESALLEHLGGPAARLIVQEADTWGADLIVVGTHGRRGFSRMVLGSDAEEVVRTSPVPVLLVRSDTRAEA